MLLYIKEIRIFLSNFYYFSYSITVAVGNGNIAQCQKYDIKFLPGIHALRSWESQNLCVENF